MLAVFRLDSSPTRTSTFHNMLLLVLLQSLGRFEICLGVMAQNLVCNVAIVLVVWLIGLLVRSSRRRSLLGRLRLLKRDGLRLGHVFHLA